MSVASLGTVTLPTATANSGVVKSVNSNESERIQTVAKQIEQSQAHYQQALDADAGAYHELVSQIATTFPEIDEKVAATQIKSKKDTKAAKKTAAIAKKKAKKIREAEANTQNMKDLTPPNANSAVASPICSSPQGNSSTTHQHNPYAWAAAKSRVQGISAPVLARHFQQSNPSSPAPSSMRMPLHLSLGIPTPLTRATSDVEDTSSPPVLKLEKAHSSYQTQAKPKTEMDHSPPLAPGKSKFFHGSDSDDSSLAASRPPSSLQSPTNSLHSSQSSLGNSYTAGGITLNSLTTTVNLSAISSSSSSSSQFGIRELNGNELSKVLFTHKKVNALTFFNQSPVKMKALETAYRNELLSGLEGITQQKIPLIELVPLPNGGLASLNNRRLRSLKKVISQFTPEIRAKFHLRVQIVDPDQPHGQNYQKHDSPNYASRMAELKTQSIKVVSNSNLDMVISRIYDGRNGEIAPTDSWGFGNIPDLESRFSDLSMEERRSLIRQNFLNLYTQ